MQRPQDCSWINCVLCPFMWCLPCDFHVISTWPRNHSKIIENHNNFVFFISSHLNYDEHAKKAKRRHAILKKMLKIDKTGQYFPAFLFFEEQYFDFFMESIVGTVNMMFLKIFPNISASIQAMFCSSRAHSSHVKISWVSYTP